MCYTNVKAICIYWLGACVHLNASSSSFSSFFLLSPFPAPPSLPASYRLFVIANSCACLARCANVKYFSARFSSHKIVLFHFQLFLSLKRRLRCAKVAGRRSTNTMYDVRCRSTDDDLRVHKYLSERFYTYYTHSVDQNLIDICFYGSRQSIYHPIHLAPPANDFGLSPSPSPFSQLSRCDSVGAQTL